MVMTSSAAFLAVSYCSAPALLLISDVLSSSCMAMLRSITCLAKGAHGLQVVGAEECILAWAACREACLEGWVGIGCVRMPLDALAC